MELNVAYEALEHMRRLNLEVACNERAVPCDHGRCTQCLLTAVPGSSATSTTSRFPRITRLVEQERQRRAAAAAESNTAAAGAQPCLICGAPTCNAHASTKFRREAKIHMCGDCESLFQIDFIVNVLTANGPRERQQHVDHMMDLYDRAVLLLRYSAQFVDDVAASLEQAQVRSNHVGLGSSSAGMVSGVLGVAAAATILTPAGPPLLIASLLFGGSATAAQAGTEVRRHYSEPSQLAARILALQGMVHQILVVLGTLRDALLRDHLRTDAYLREHGDETLSTLVQEHRATVLAGLTLGRGAAAGLEIGQIMTTAELGVLGGRSARLFSRSGTTVMRSLRFARFAGGALSAATLLLEARGMQQTIAQIQAGSPCDKATALRRLPMELETLPSTESLDEECLRYLSALTQRERRMTQEEAVRLLLEQCQLTEEDDHDHGNELAPDMPLEGSTSGTRTDSLTNAPSAYRSQSSSLSSDSSPSSSPLRTSRKGSDMSASLLERIQLHKQREESSPQQTI